MPTASTHPGAAYSLITELALTVLARFRKNASKDQYPAHINFSTHRVGIASAICIRDHGVNDLDEHTPEVEAWLGLTSLSYQRRLLLIQAGIPVANALVVETSTWDDSTLRTMIALNRMGRG